jgi:acyl-CoA thioester hydrolase
MASFRFYYPIDVRYGDLDPQGHVNNACFFTYIEQARVNYVKSLGLWDGESFMDIGFILADAQMSFKATIQYGQPVQVGVRVTRLGNKSLTMEYRLEEAGSGVEFASGATVLVAYDYHQERSISIPERWREAIAEFENIPDHP